jgi:N-acetylglucosaminyldiphosphoundecaprenol N-acetyl-beta-D-mannosaminyltransferase
MEEIDTTVLNKCLNGCANFLGIQLEALSYEQMFTRIDIWLRNKSSRSHHIACINAYCVVLTLQNKRLAKIYNSADLSGPDGMPFVKWMRKTLKVSCDRFAAPDIAIQLAKRAKKKKYTFYLYGGAPDVLLKMKENLEKEFPHINIVGHYSPPFRALTPEENEEIVNNINKLSPDIILVGLGTPKQDYWIDENLYKIRGAVLIASGATFDFFGGRIKMAPEYIRKSGFEWLYRLFSKDFFRLFKRYTILNFVFLWNFLLQLLHIRTRHPETYNRPD